MPPQSSFCRLNRPFSCFSQGLGCRSTISWAALLGTRSNSCLSLRDARGRLTWGGGAMGRGIIRRHRNCLKEIKQRTNVPRQKKRNAWMRHLCRRCMAGGEGERWGMKVLELPQNLHRVFPKPEAARGIGQWSLRTGVLKDAATNFSGDSESVSVSV